MIATAQARDGEMEMRIARHQQDRAERLPGMQTIEEPVAIGEALGCHSTAQTLVVIDCLTLWLTNLLMPHQDPEISLHSPENKSNGSLAQEVRPHSAMLLVAIEKAAGPVVLVGNEIGLGVIPMGRDSRQFVDALGRLNQEVAAACSRVSLMVAGLPLVLKDSS